MSVYSDTSTKHIYDFLPTHLRALAYVSIPLGIAYIAGVSVIENFEILTLATIILWVGIPGGLSYLFFHKKCGGK